MSDQILETLAKFTALGGGSAAVAVLLFKYFSKSWIENKFSERLEQFKHLQNIEIQNLSVKIDSKLSAVLKLQEKEFETLTEAWSKLDEAHIHVTSLVSPAQQYPDLDGMTPDRLDEFLSECDLRETQKTEIIQSREKTKRYIEVMFWYRLHAVRLACSDLNRYVVRYGIFFPPSLKKYFYQIVEKLNAAVLDKSLGHEMNDYKLQSESWEKLKNEISPLFGIIEDEIHNRLRSYGASASESGSPDKLDPSD